jgi:hypothetical protein
MRLDAAEGKRIDLRAVREDRAGSAEGGAIDAAEWEIDRMDDMIHLGFREIFDSTG